MGEKDEEPDREIIYHYSREQRLEKASRQVRELNEGTIQRPGFFNSRFAGSKSNMLTLICIMIIMAVVAVTTGRGGIQKGLKIGGNEISLSLAKNGEGQLSLGIKKTIPQGVYAYTGSVLIAVSPVQKKAPAGEENAPPLVMADRIFFTLEDEEHYGFVLPFDGEEFVVILESENERIIQRLKKPKPR